MFTCQLTSLFQPKQRTSIVSAFEFHRLNHSHDYFEINSSIGYASFTSSPPISPANYSVGSVEGSIEDNDITGNFLKNLLLHYTT